MKTKDLANEIGSDTPTSERGGYAFDFQGGTFTPDGKIEVPSTEAHNQATEDAEIAYLKTGPQNAYLYVKHPVTHPDGSVGCWKVTTWPGTVICTAAAVGPRRYIGFGYHTYRRAISANIYGVLYHGWYMESSGDYCRLTKAKRQPKAKIA